MIQLNNNIDLEQYINMVAARLDRCQLIPSRKLVKGRCPICGDSKTKKNKTRAYIYYREGNYFFFCHNCDRSMLFVNFMKEYFSDIYSLYQFERISSSKSTTSNIIPSVVPNFSNGPSLRSLEFMATRVDRLDLSHSAILYCRSRGIPESMYNRMWHTDKFDQIKELTDKFEYVKPEPRLIFPFANKQNQLVGLHARSYEKDPKLRYIIVKLIDDLPMIFGLDKFEINKKTFVLEGPLKSLFLPNALSTGNSKLESTEKFISKDRTTLIYDREPRNPEICRNILHSINNGFSICLLPSKFDGKDVDQIFLNHQLTEESLISIVNDHTYSGLSAKLEFNRWKKC
jgi:hypothetical protein